MKFNKDLIHKIINNEPFSAAEVITLLGGYVENYPVLGTTISADGKHIVERDIRSIGNIDITYDLDDNDRLKRIYIGHKYAGPMLMCQKVKNAWRWHNLYTNQDYGKNWSCGGTWYFDATRNYSTATECLEYRDYLQRGGLPQHPQIYRESKKLLREVWEFVEQFEKEIIG